MSLLHIMLDLEEQHGVSHSTIGPSKRSPLVANVSKGDRDAHFIDLRAGVSVYMTLDTT